MKFTKVNEENLEAFQDVLDPSVIEAGDYVAAAEEDGAPAGAVVFSIEEPTASLLLKYIYVDEKQRRKGIGSAMLRQICDDLKPIALYTEFSDEEESLYPFFESLGFALLETSEIYRIPAAAFLENEGCRDMLEAAGRRGIVRLDLVDEKAKKQLDKMLDEAELDVSVSSMEGPDARISMISMNEETGEPAGCLLAEMLGKDVVITLFFSAAGDPMMFPGLFGAFHDALKEEGLLEGEISFVTEEDSVASFVKKLTGGEAKPAGMMVSGIRSLPEEDTEEEDGE